MRDWFTKDWNWKLFSICMAVAIWLTVHKFSGGGTPGLLSAQNTFTNISVNAVSSSARLQNVSLQTNVVSVTVSGAPDVIGSLDSESIHAVVYLTGVDVASNLNCSVTVAVPPRVTVLSVNPPTMTVTIPSSQ